MTYLLYGNNEIKKVIKRRVTSANIQNFIRSYIKAIDNILVRTPVCIALPKN